MSFSKRGLSSDDLHTPEAYVPSVWCLCMMYIHLENRQENWRSKTADGEVEKSGEGRKKKGKESVRMYTTIVCGVYTPQKVAMSRCR